MLASNRLQRRLQIAGIFLILGLSVEALCLFWAKPIAFVIFVAFGGFLLFVGIVTYLISLVSLDEMSM